MRFALSSQTKWFLGTAAILFLAAVAAGAFIYSDQILLMSDQQQLPALSDPKIVILKAKRELQLFDGATLIKTYKIGLGKTPSGDKEIEGDRKTPEGDFYIFVKNPKSRFHLGLGVSYPNSEDAKRGFSAGIITKDERSAIETAIAAGEMPLQNTKLGGEIYIHGGGNLADWTHGCIAMTNSDMQEVYDAVGKGTAVTVRQ
jgi:murein L,D-transpeptidase YafK